MTNGKKTILFVMPDSPLRSTLAERFGDEGFGTLSAGDGTEGVALAVGHLPDIIVIDKSSTATDCSSIIKKVRGYDWGKYLPILVLSETSEPSELAPNGNGNGPLFFFHDSTRDGDGAFKEIRARLADAYPST